MARGKAFTNAEDDLLRLWVKNKKPLAKLAKRIGRSRSAVYNRKDILEARGTLFHDVFDFCDEDGEQ